MAKRIKITDVDKMSHELFQVNIDDEYDVISEGKGEIRYGYCINTKNNKSIVMYDTQVKIIN